MCRGHGQSESIVTEGSGRYENEYNRASRPNGLSFGKSVPYWLQASENQTPWPPDPDLDPHDTGRLHLIMNIYACAQNHIKKATLTAACAP